MPFTQNTTPTFAKQPRKGLQQILPADTTAQKTLITAGANGSKVFNVLLSSTDTAARDVQLILVRGGVSYFLTTTTVAANSGFTAGTPVVDLLNTTNLPAGMLAWDHDGFHYLNLESGDTLVIASLTTVTSAKAISAHSDYEDF